MGRSVRCVKTMVFGFTALAMPASTSGGRCSVSMISMSAPAANFMKPVCSSSFLWGGPPMSPEKTSTPRRVSNLIAQQSMFA